MSKVFISHAHEDRGAAEQISAALAQAGHEPWLDYQSIGPGDELLKEIARVLTEAHYFLVLLSNTALTKSWVLTEMRMALTAEIQRLRPTVIAVRLDDCVIPPELGHKVYLDCRGRFDEALKELVGHVSGAVKATSDPPQEILAKMITNADAELWARLSHGGGGEWERSDAANAIRDLRPDELDAAVRIGAVWKDYKLWDSDIVDIIRRGSHTSVAGARRILKKLAEKRFLEEANDLDYSEQPEIAWCDGDILRILRRAAERSGRFVFLPPPLPERLSSLLAYEKPVEIISTGWYAVRFEMPVVTALDTNGAAIIAISSHAEPRRTWVFRSADDRTPLTKEQYFSVTEISPTDPFACSSEKGRLQMLRLDLSVFDDLNLLQGKA